jgi:hypothetical protein
MSRHLAHNILRHLEPWRYCSFDFAHRSRHFVSSGYHHATYKPQLFFHPAVKDALEVCNLRVYGSLLASAACVFALPKVSSA